MLNITSYSYSFEKLINKKFLYIDKTEYIWNLICPGDGGYFLSRPRRFGKSLTVSTLEAIFEGKKELFKGLAIYDKPYDWKPYPVIHLDLNGFKYDSVENLNKSLCCLVQEVAAKYKIALLDEDPNLMLRKLITKLSDEESVVILIDEYDKPILDNIDSPIANDILKNLKAFYSAVKAFEGKERFVFITGVSKFCHVSLFSDLNNLTDISTDYDYATMLGYTQQELENYFAEHIELACKKLNMPRETLLSEIKAWYNGYRFEEESETVYNPVSLARFFTTNKFSNYWFSTGTPSFLLKLMRQKQFNLEQSLIEPVTELAFDAFEIDKIDPQTLMLQTGYLTIKSSFVDLGETLYYLDFPNREVKAAFEMYFISYYTTIPENVVGTQVLKMVKAIQARDINLFMELLKTFFASISSSQGVDCNRNQTTGEWGSPQKYPTSHASGKPSSVSEGWQLLGGIEGRFQSLFFAIFLLVGVKIEAESRTNNGRIDAVIVDRDQVFIFEFKTDETAEIALEQIQNKEYFQKYQHSGKKIMLIGVNYDTKARQIADWVTQNLE